MGQTQTIPKPPTRADWWEAFEAGLIIDTEGKRLTRGRCDRCNSFRLGSEPCIRCDFACPACGAQQEQRCRRPSEHQTADWHAARRAAFDKYVDQLEADGFPGLPARWSSTEDPSQPSLLDLLDAG